MRSLVSDLELSASYYVPGCPRSGSSKRSPSRVNLPRSSRWRRGRRLRIGTPAAGCSGNAVLPHGLTCVARAAGPAWHPRLNVPARRGIRVHGAYRP